MCNNHLLSGRLLAAAWWASFFLSTWLLILGRIPGRTWPVCLVFLLGSLAITVLVHGAVQAARDDTAEEMISALSKIVKSAPRVGGNHD